MRWYTLAFFIRCTSIIDPLYLFFQILLKTYSFCEKTNAWGTFPVFIRTCAELYVLCVFSIKNIKRNNYTVPHCPIFPECEVVDFYKSLGVFNACHPLECCPWCYFPLFLKPPKNKRKKKPHVFWPDRKSMKKPKKNCCRVARWSATWTWKEVWKGRGAIKSWEPKGTRDPMPRLPPRNKTLFRDCGPLVSLNPMI